MGWCSGTDIMDAAVEAGDALVEHLLKRVNEDGENASDVLLYERDQILAPFVRRIAKKLHDGDWDCVDEAAAFDRFPQEMYDHDDQEHEAWIREHLEEAARYDEPEQVLRWSQMLKAHTDKMEASKK